MNTGKDPAKSGCRVDEAPALLDACLTAGCFEVQGLMTIAPLAGDPAVAQRAFADLRDLRDRLQVHSGLLLPELSMGMSGDLAIAIAEGSTLVRIGTDLFGSRQKPH